MDELQDQALSKPKLRKRSYQRRDYIKFRLAGFKPIEAATKAGYSAPDKNAYKIEAHPEVQAAMEKQQKELEAKVLYTREQAIADLLRGIEMAKTQGDPTALRACVQELNKIMGYHAPEKKETSISVVEDRKTQLKTLENASDEYLLERLGKQGMVVDGEYEVASETDDTA